MAEISIVYRNGMVVAKPLSDDDEDESPGRILTVEEFIDRLRIRSDIFGVDKNHRLRNVEVVALVLGVIAGFLTATREPSIVRTADFYEKAPDAGSIVAISTTIIDRNLARPTAVRKPVTDVEGRKRLRPGHTSEMTNTRPSHDNSSGSIRSRVANSAFFTSLAQSMRGIDAERGELFGKGGFSEKLDAIFSGNKGGISKGGMTSTGRKGYEHIGYGPGHGKSGFDGEGPGGGGDDIFQNIAFPAESAAPLTLITGPPDRIKNAAITPVLKGIRFSESGRSRIDIMRVVMQNLSALRYAYNQRLRDRPGLTGKITIKFAVDEFGNVIACEVIESSVADNQLETIIKGKILRWRFDRIDKPGDITEVVYPFVFST